MPLHLAVHEQLSGNFVLVSATGPWSLAATIILEGTIYEGGNALSIQIML